MKQSTKKQFTKNSKPYSENNKYFGKAKPKTTKLKSESSEGKKPKKQENPKTKTKMITYSMEIPTDEFQNQLNDLIDLIPEAEDIFGKCFEGTTFDAAHIILQKMSEVYKQGTYWSCIIKSKSAQIITNSKIGFGWIINSKDNTIKLSVFLVEANEKVETKLANAGYKSIVTK